MQDNSSKNAGRELFNSEATENKNNSINNNNIR